MEDLVPLSALGRAPPAGYRRGLVDFYVWEAFVFVVHLYLHVIALPFCLTLPLVAIYLPFPQLYQKSSAALIMHYIQNRYTNHIEKSVT